MGLVPIADPARRMIMIAHKRFLEIAAQIEELPETTQPVFIGYLWTNVQNFLMLIPEEMQKGAERKDLLLQFQYLHQFLDVFEGAVIAEKESVELDHSMALKGFPEIAEAFRKQRHAAICKEV